uniref:F-box domain-containing protein n=1 Tax=Salix viminalis TaxID=40686 RepID=A0A6N2N8F8_SALVM
MPIPFSNLSSNTDSAGRKNLIHSKILGISEEMPLNELPEGCIANALSFTTPQDVGRLSAVSPIFMSAAVSDVVWERDLESILSTSPDGSRLLASAASKKELYFSLCENPVLVDNGRKSFSLEKKSGKKCCRLSARDLLITWGDTPEYWTWNSDPASRFPEVAELISVCWLEIRAKINTSMLSPTTLHTAYLVLKFSRDTYCYGLDDQPVEVAMKLDGEESCTRTVSWNAERRRGQERGDGWLEIELGEFFTKEGKDEELEIRVFDGSSHWKRGLIVEGIEIRPKQEELVGAGCTGWTSSSEVACRSRQASNHTMGKKGGERRDSSFHMMLPEGCLAKVLSFTCPRDACRLSVVSSLFKSAADSDIVWKSFFPHDYRSIISQSNSSLQLASVTSSMKELYLKLCDKPTLIENGRKSFSLNKPSGEKCFMLSAKSLEIAWKDFRICWRWDSDPESRFDQVAHLLRVPTLTIIGKISARMLSPATWYTAYLVFKFFTVHFGSKQKNGFSLASGFDGLSAKVSVGLVGGKTSSRTVFWDVEGWRRLQNRSNKRRCSVSSAATSNIYYPKDRGDGWLEIRLGDFFNKEGEDGDLEMIVDDNIYHVKKVKSVGEEGMSISVLPEGCIAKVLSFTGPTDACRLSIVSSLFKSAEESDAVWERFLPRDYQSIIFTSDSSVLLASLSSKKELYLRLCEKPIIIDDGKKSFSLVKKSGKKCYMLSARDLMIVWGDTPSYWRWNSDSSSRFGEVAELISVCWLEIRGRIYATMLSPETLYAAYLVFKPTEGAHGLDYQPVEVGVGVVGSENGKRNVYLASQRGQSQRHHLVRRRIGLYNRSRLVGMQEPVAARENNAQNPRERGDGWLEIELGEFFCEEGEDRELEMSVQEVKGGDWKGGMIVEGIELRPKEG